MAKRGDTLCQGALARSALRAILTAVQSQGSPMPMAGPVGIGGFPFVHVASVVSEWPAVDVALPEATAAHRSERSEEHTSELQSLMRISYAVFCLKKKKKQKIRL